MKTAFSTSWKSSVQPRKQRKYVHNAPLHIKNKMLSVHLSKELAKKYSTRAISVRTGDKVKVMRGTHKGKEGKVEKIDLVNLKVYVSKIETKKLDGSSSKYPLRPSNLLITSVVDDKRRFSKSKQSKQKKQVSKSELQTKTTEETANKITEENNKMTNKMTKEESKKVVKKVVGKN